MGAYVKRQKDGRNLALVGVNQRIRQALQVTRVENFFRFYGTLAALNKRIENWIPTLLTERLECS